MKKTRFPGFTLVELLVVIAIIGVLIALLLPAINACREAARRASCENNLRQLGIALHGYESAHEFLPAGVINSESPVINYPKGNHMGWMVQLLPYLDERPLYQMIDQSAGVYDPKNATVRRAAIPLFMCPSFPGRSFEGSHDSSRHDENDKPVEGERGVRQISNYAGCVGDAASGIDEKCHGVLVLNRNIRLEDITDGQTHTIFIGEKMPDRYDLGWMSGTCATLRSTGEPIDNGSRNNLSASPLEKLMTKGMIANDFISPDELKNSEVREALEQIGGFGSSHPGICMFMMGDGRVLALYRSIDSKTYALLGNRSDGDPLIDGPTRE